MFIGSRVFPWDFLRFVEKKVKKMCYFPYGFEHSVCSWGFIGLNGFGL